MELLRKKTKKGKSFLYLSPSEGLKPYKINSIVSILLEKLSYFSR